MTREERKRRRAGRLRFWIMLPDRNSGGSLYDGSGCSGKLPAYGRGIFAGDRSGKRAARGFGRSL